MHMHGVMHTHGFTHLNVTRLRQIVTHILGNVTVGTVELHLYMIFPMTILIYYLIIINAIFPYLIVFSKIN